MSSKFPHAKPASRGADTWICFSHLRWKFVYQRPQHLISRAARTHRVLFFEEPLFEGSALPHLEMDDDPTGVTIVRPIFPEGFSSSIAEHTRRLLDGLLERVEPCSTLWYYTPMALEFSRHLRHPVCVYDNMDELSAFRGASSELLRLENELFQRADIVFTGGRSLYLAKRHRHSNIHVFPSSIDRAHFAQARSAVTEPADQAMLPRPRLGFFGVIDERMDLDLVCDIADRRPDWQIIMIGPVVKIDPDTLPSRSNIAWLGMKSYAELPYYLAGWDIGIMPFARNEATRFISPTKTPEFLAAGVPLVCTEIADVIDPYGKDGLVEIADEADSFILACERLLRQTTAPWLEKVDRHLAGNSWDRTWTEMEALIAGAAKAIVPADRPVRGETHV